MSATQSKQVQTQPNLVDLEEELIYDDGTFEQYLINYHGIDAGFIKEYYQCLKDKMGCCIYLPMAIRWLGEKSRTGIIRKLEAEYDRGIDYEIMGGEYYVSVRCFKNIALQSRQSMGDTVRKYYQVLEIARSEYRDLEMKKLTERNEQLENENSKLKAEVSKLRQNLLASCSERKDAVYICKDELNTLCQKTGEPYYVISGRIGDANLSKATIPYIYRRTCVSQDTILSMLECMLAKHRIRSGSYGVRLDCLKEIITASRDITETIAKWYALKHEDISVMSIPKFELPLD